MASARKGLAYLLTGVTLLITAAHADSFDSSKEFPNYFLPEPYRNTPPELIPQSVITDSHARLENALKSVFDRLTVPIVKAGQNRAAPIRYFPMIRDELRQLDPGLHVMPSGGIVRSALTYLYAQIQEGLSKSPPVSPEATLDQIIRAKDDLPAIEVRGIGSDFDVLIQGPQASADRAIQTVIAITNSAESRYGMSKNPNSTTKRVFFTIGDAKEYDAQINLASVEGGATIDLLAFDVEQGHLVDPKLYPKVSEDFIRGVSSYVAPLKPETLLDETKQTVRGIRTRMELPWLKLRDESQLRRELETLRSSLRQGQTPSPKALEQFDKMVRNARYSGAHNRFYRGEPGSVDSLVLEIVELIHAKTGVRKIPEFIDTQPLAGRTAAKSELHGVPAKALLPMDEFTSRYTHDGILYHGTPSLENSLAILRQGLFVSKQEQGRAAFGRGAYASREANIASQYAGSGGLVFNLEVPRDPRVNILDWKRWQNDPWFRALQDQAVSRGRDVFDVLAKEHGIDIIVNEHVLIQNSEAVRLPGGLRQLLDGFALKVQDPAMPVKVRLSAFENLQSLSPFGQDLGLQTPSIPPAVLEDLGVQVLTHGRTVTASELLQVAVDRQVANDRLAALQMLAGFDDQKSLDAVAPYMFVYRYDLAKLAHELVLARPLEQIRPLIPKMLASSYDSFAKVAFEALKKKVIANGENHLLLEICEAMLKNTDFHARAAALISLSGLTDQKSLDLIFSQVFDFRNEELAIKLVLDRPLEQVRPYLKRMIAYPYNNVARTTTNQILHSGLIGPTDPDYNGLTAAAKANSAAHYNPPGVHCIANQIGAILSP